MRGKRERRGGLWVLAFCLMLALLPSAAIGAEPPIEPQADYFHKGLGHDVPLPEWAKDAHVNFTAPPGKGPAAEIKELEESGTVAALTQGEGLTKSSLLTYFGGRVQRTPHPHLIFWGSNWNKPGETQQIREALTLMFSGLSGSGYQGIMTQYFWNPTSNTDRHPLPITKSVPFNPVSDVWVDTSVAAPTNVGRTTVTSEVLKARAAKGWPAGFDEQYFVFPAPGSAYQANFLGPFCGYHGFSEGSSYAFVAYPGTVAGCGTTPKDISRYASHEFAETVTDTIPDTGWSIPILTPDGKLLDQVEIADYCTAQASKQLENGGWVHPLKDNYRTNVEAGESIHCEASNPSPPQMLLEGPSVDLGQPGFATLSGSIDPAGYPEVKYWFERYSASWVKIAGGGVVGGTGATQVSQQITGTDVSSAERYRLVAQIPTGGYKEETTGRVFSQETLSRPAWSGILCDTAEKPCPKTERIPVGTDVTGVAVEKPFFELILNNMSTRVKCGSSSWGAEIGEWSKAGQRMSGTGWSFSSCKLEDKQKEPSCNVYTSTSPLMVDVVWRGGSDGEIWNAATEGSEIGWHIECPGAVEPIDCTYSPPSTNVLKGGVAPELRTRILGQPAVQAKEDQTGLLCPGYLGNAKANYSLTAPQPLHVAPVGSSQPAISLDKASSVGEASALLSGTINPKGHATEFRFEYVEDDQFEEDLEALGPEHGFDHALSTPLAGEAIGSGTAPVAVQRKIEDLEPATIYHARLVAENVEGQTLGGPITFSTVAVPTYKSTFGSSGNGNGQFQYMTDVAIDPSDGTLWVTDDDNDRVQHFTRGGGYLGQFKSCYDPGSIVVDDSGALYVACSSAGVVQKYNAKGEALKVIANSGSGEGQVRFPLDLAIDSEGDIWAADTENDQLDEFDPQDGFVGSVALGVNARPWGIGISPDDEIWVSEPWSYRVSVFDSSGDLLRRIGSRGTGDGEFERASDVEVDEHGYAWVADAVNNRIQVFNEAGEYVTQFGSKGSGPGQFDTDWWLRIDVAENGDLWVTDSGNSRLVRWRVLERWAL